jgi:Na+/phosphate symporter
MRARRERSVTESLLSIVLVIEAFVLFFAGLVAFGLKVLEPAFPAWVALPAAAVLIVVLLATTVVLRFAWGKALGWVLQAALIALGILLPMMYVVGGGFALLWIFCFTRGRRIDASRTTTPQGEN